MPRRTSGNVGIIIDLIFCMIKFYWLWELCPVWLQAPLQCVAVYYVATFYFYFIPLYYKDVMNGYLFDTDHGVEMMLESLFAIGTPILFYFLYTNTLNKIYQSIMDITGAYTSYFIESGSHIHQQ